MTSRANEDKRISAKHLGLKNGIPSNNVKIN